MVLLAVSTSNRLSLFDHDPIKPYQLPTPVELPELESSVVHSAWSLGSSLAVATTSGSIWVFEEAGRASEAFQVIKGSKNDLPITSLLLDSHEGLVIIYAQGSMIHCVDARTTKRLNTYEHFPSPINNISLSSDGLMLAAGHESGQACTFHRATNTHQVISLHPRAPVILAQLHPTRRNILLLVLRSSSSRLLIYDVLKASSPLKIVDLSKLPSPGNITALAFHGSGSHAALVSDAGELFTVNLETGSTRTKDLKIPLTSVAWTGKTSLVLGSETGRLLLRDAQGDAANDLFFGEGGDPIQSLTVQPAQTTKPVAKKKTLGNSNAANRVSSATSSAMLKEDSGSSRRMSKLGSSSSSDAVASSSRHPQSTPASSANVSSVYAPTPASSYRCVDPTPSHVLPRHAQVFPNPRTDVGTNKTKRVLWGDEAHDDGSCQDGSTPRPSTNSPPLSRSSSCASSSASRSLSRYDDQRSYFPSTPKTVTTATGRMSVASAGNEHTTYASFRSPSPRDTTSPPPPPRLLRLDGEDSPLISAMSVQIRDLHLDMLRARRETRREMKAMFAEHFGDLKELREENKRLKAENERLRRGY